MEIKKLEWSDTQNTAQGVKGYWVSEYLEEFFLLYDGVKIGRFDTKDLAQTKAQEHFEKCVMKFLNVRLSAAKPLKS